MIKHKTQQILMVLMLFISTLFLYGCSGDTETSKVKESTIRLEVRDITTKAPIDNVVVVVRKISGDEIPIIAREGKTDSRGKIVFGGLAPDFKYSILLSKDGYQRPQDPNLEFIPNINADGGLFLEQGTTYDLIGYMLRAESLATGTIKGYVKNAITGEPITNATVYVLIDGKPKTDTTDKPSKPGYYELSNIPSNLTVTVLATVPGNTSQGKVENVVVPPNGSINVDIAVVPDGAKITGTITSAPSETLPRGEYVVLVLRNGTETTASKKIVVSGEELPTSVDYEIENIPIIMAGSTSTYTIKVISDMAHMYNPASGITGVAIRSKEQPINIPPIAMMPEKGTVLITLYHKPVTSAELLNGHPPESTLSQHAAQATMVVEGALVETIFVNEGPTRFYRYRLNNVPVGKRKLYVHFPAHSVGQGVVEINAIKDSEVSYTFTLVEAQ